MMMMMITTTMTMIMTGGDDLSSKDLAKNVCWICRIVLVDVQGPALRKAFNRWDYLCWSDMFQDGYAASACLNLI